jgi:hypothetical protein
LQKYTRVPKWQKYTSAALSKQEQVPLVQLQARTLKQWVVRDIRIARAIEIVISPMKEVCVCEL